MTPVALAGSYLVLETTNRCSLACVHCTVSEAGHPHHARDGFLPLATAEALFDDLRAVGARFDTLILFWLGEPLIHPEFGAIYQAALRSTAFGRVEVHTNATHLARDRIRVALNDSPVPQTWHLTIDAATPETYRAVKGRDELDRVEANVRAFLEARRDRRARWPRPVIEYIVQERNAGEVSAFRKRWAPWVEAVGAQQVPAGESPVLFFRQLDAPTPAEQESANQLFRATMAREGIALPAPSQTPSVLGVGTPVCSCFWKSPVVGWDGTVTTCTRDNRLENALGNLHERPFSRIWWGPRTGEARRAVARGDYSGLRACAGCYIPQSANYVGISRGEIEAHG